MPAPRASRSRSLIPSDQCTLTEGLRSRRPWALSDPSHGRRDRLASMHAHSRKPAVQATDSATLDDGSNVDDIPQPHRLAERGW